MRTCSTICSGLRACGAISATASRIRLRLRMETRSASRSFRVASSAGLRDLRRTHVVEQPLVLGLEPIEQRAHVLVRQELREVIVDDLAQMGEQHRDRIDRLEAFAPGVLDEGLGNRDRPYAEGGFAHFVAGQIGTRSVADDDEVVLDPQFLGRDRGAVNLDLVGLRRRLDVVGETDLRNDEAVLAGELAPHLGDAGADLVARRAAARR